MYFNGEMEKRRILPEGGGSNPSIIIITMAEALEEETFSLDH